MAGGESGCGSDAHSDSRLESLIPAALRTPSAGVHLRRPLRATTPRTAMRNDRSWPKGAETDTVATDPSRTLALPGEQAICMAKARSAVSGILGFALRVSTGFGRRPGSS
jgi:hypothetical protein